MAGSGKPGRRKIENPPAKTMVVCDVTTRLSLKRLAALEGRGMREELTHVIESYAKQYMATHPYWFLEVTKNEKAD